MSYFLGGLCPHHILLWLMGMISIQNRFLNIITAFGSNGMRNILVRAVHNVFTHPHEFLDTGGFTGMPMNAFTGKIEEGNDRCGTNPIFPEGEIFLFHAFDD